MVVEIVDDATRDTGVADVLIGSIGLTGVLVLAGLLLGLVAGALFISIRRLSERHTVDDDARPRPDSLLH